MQSPWAISFRIWIAAVLTNTVIGVAWLAGLGGFTALGLLFLGLFASALFSLPIPFVLETVIRNCRLARMQGGWALFWTYVTGIVCTVIIHCCFMLFILDKFFYTDKGLLLLNIFSAILGVTVQAHRLVKISTIEPE